MNCATHPERERVAFCQNCGKPLCGECSRAIGAGIFCEPCLVARLAAADASTGYTAVPGASAMVPPVPGVANPALAALLGFIPGVGAMYNGQYAKGVVHLIVFAVLVSLADSVEIFGLFVAGWEFYMAIEAYHTAKARRDGTVLPNPFGLNDVGERFGFGKGWTGPAAAAPAAGASAVYRPQTGPQFTQSSDGSQSYGGSTNSSWGAPSESYAPPVPPFTGVPGIAYPQAPLTVPPNRFPAGAIWLIGLGLLFFFGSSGLFRHFPIQRIIPFLLVGLGVWIFIRKMMSSGQALADDGGPAYQLRVFRALRGPVWLILIGVLFFLDSYNILSWGRSWPLFIIVGGVMALLERSAYNGAVVLPYGPASATVPQPAGTPGAAAPTSPGTAIVPLTPHDDEGR